MTRPLFLITACAALLGCASATALNKEYDRNRIRRIGVLKFEDARNANLGAEDIFAKHLIRRGYSVIERTRLEALLREQKLSATGAVALSGVKDIGKILGVDALIIGTISSYEPQRKQVVMVNVQRTYTEPVFKKVRKKVERNQDEKGPDKYIDVHEQIGKKSRYEDKEVPQLLVVDARVGIIAKLVDVETGEIIWVGSAAREGVNSVMAVESAVSYLIRRLRKELKPAKTN
jgi:hypothetical protein